MQALLQITNFNISQKGHVIIGPINIANIFNEDEDPFLVYIWNHTAKTIYDRLIDEGLIDGGIKKK